MPHSSFAYDQLMRRINELEVCCKMYEKDNCELRSELYKLKAEYDSFCNNIQKYMNLDQLNALKRNSTKFMEWSDETCEKAISIRYLVGSIGYDAVRKLIPLPSSRTLFRRLECFNFFTGICALSVNFLKNSFINFPQELKRGCLVLDRMSLIPGEDVDRNGNFLGHDTLKDDRKIKATEGLAILFAGTVLRMKQIVAHHYTEKSIKGIDMKRLILEIIHMMWEISQIWIDSIVCDLGSENTAMLKEFGVSISAQNSSYKIVHPINQEKYLYFIADAVHAFKNIGCQFRAKESALIPDKFVELYNLASNVARLSDVLKIFNIQKKMTFLPAQNLTKSVIKPDQWEKMRVKTHTRFFNSDVSTAISFIFEKDHEDIEQFLSEGCSLEFVSSIKLNPTSWLFKKIENWISIMKCRAQNKYNLKDENSLASLINPLTEMIEIFEGLKIGNQRLPSINGAIKSSKTIIELANLYKNDGIEYFVPGFFTQDCVENVFSIVRSVRPLPSCKQFSQQLRSQIVSRFLQPCAKNTSYDFEDDFVESNISFINFLKENKSLGLSESEPEETEIHSQILAVQQELEYDLSVDIENIELFYNSLEQSTFYYIVGYLIHRIQKKVHCDTCRNFLIDKEIIPTHLNRLMRLKIEKNNFDATEPSESVFQYHLKMERIFRRLEEFSLRMSNANFKKEFEIFVLSTVSFNEMHCEATKLIITQNFINFRLFITREKRDVHKRCSFSSKSMK